MSKIQQLPSQKGTELWPNTTQMPTKLVIKGVDGGTPLAAAIVDHFDGRLKSFHAKQQQNYALSATAQHRAHVEWKGGRATYVNQGGQEYLTLEVDPELLTALETKDKPVPDFCVVDIAIRNSADIYAEFGAAVIAPQIARVSPPPSPGVEMDYLNAPDWSSLNPKAFMRYAAKELSTGNVAVANRVSSLLVDFRNMPENAMVSIDLYGQLYPDNNQLDPAPQIFLGYQPNPSSAFNAPTPGELYTASSLVDTITYTIKYGMLNVPDVVTWPGGTGNSINQVTAYEQGRAPDGSTYASPYVNYYNNNTVYEYQYQSSWSPVLTDLNYGLNGGKLVSRVVYSPGDPQFVAGYSELDTYLAYRWANTYYRPKQPVYGNAYTPFKTTRTADLVFKYYEPGQKFFIDSLRDHRYYNYFAMWTEQEGVVPARKQFRSVSMDSSTSSPVTADNRWGYTYLGRVVLTREWRAIGFKPA